MKETNNQAFIDGQNLFLGTITSKEPWKVDLFRFREYLRQKYDVGRAYYFIGCRDGRLQELYDRIREAGFVLIFRAHEVGAVSSKKGNVDTDIVFMMMKNFHEGKEKEKILLVSGDGDYYKTVKYLKEKDRLAKVLIPVRNKASSLYRKINNANYSFLDDSDIKKKIEKK
ncbi:NYN domain-containing protein [Candidatus Saccharibacteria bacterium]|nr:NYN domain-containing protein [Candidatus Saccharibacteria bacterium]